MQSCGHKLYYNSYPAAWHLLGVGGASERSPNIPRKNLFSGFQLTLGWSVCLVIGHNQLSVIQLSRFILNLIDYLIKSFNCFREIVDTSKDARESIKLI